MHDAYYFSISSLPTTAKQAISERLLTARVSDRVREEFQRVADFMNRGVSLDGELLRRELGILDRKRTQNLVEIEPELAELVGYTSPENPHGQ